MKKSKIIDFHTHILHGVDHGSTSLEVSLEQVKMFKANGIDTVVSTSHYYPHKDDLDLFLSVRENSYNELKESMTEQGIDLDIRLGAEVLLCAGLDRLHNIDKLCIQGTRILLVELPFSDFRNEYMETLENLIEKGYKIVLAHVDRYPPDIIEPLSYLDIKFQVNARSLCGLLKRPILHNWIKRGTVVALGSDIHMLNKSAIAELIRCKKKLKNQFDSIMLKSYEILNTL